MAGKGEEEAEEGGGESCSFSHVWCQLELEDFMNGIRIYVYQGRKHLVGVLDVNACLNLKKTVISNLFYPFSQ